VDDEHDLVNLAQRILEGKRYQVAPASDGEESLRKAASQTPDLNNP